MLSISQSQYSKDCLMWYCKDCKKQLTIDFYALPLKTKHLYQNPPNQWWTFVVWKPTLLLKSIWEQFDLVSKISNEDRVEILNFPKPWEDFCFCFDCLWSQIINIHAQAYILWRKLKVLVGHCVALVFSTIFMLWGLVRSPKGQKWKSWIPENPNIGRYEGLRWNGTYS